MTEKERHEFVKYAYQRFYRWMVQDYAVHGSKEWHAKLSGRPRTAEMRKKISASMSQFWKNNPEYAERKKEVLAKARQKRHERVMEENGLPSTTTKTEYKKWCRQNKPWRSLTNKYHSDYYHEKVKTNPVAMAKASERALKKYYAGDRGRQLAYARLQAETLTDGYVISALRANSGISADALPAKDIPKNLIEAKRAQLRLTRLIRTQSATATLKVTGERNDPSNR